MIKGVNHIGIAVTDLAEAVAFYRDVLGIEESGREEVPDQKVRVAFFDLGGVKIELLESTSPDGPIGKHIEKRGPGLHHLSFTSTDIKQDLTAIQQKGGRLIDEVPRDGANGAQIAFVHPKTTGGVLLELCEEKTSNDSGSESNG